MANSLGSNYGKKVMQSIAAGFENARVSTKSVNTTNIQGKYNSSTGAVIYDKRKTSFRAGETSDGDVSSNQADNDILVGQIPYTKQNVITVRLAWDTVEEALELNQLDELIAPAGEELITRAELNFNTYMVNNSGLTVGTPGTQISSWEDVAACEALMEEIGVPKSGKRYYQMNSYSSMNLAGVQVGIPAQDRSRTAWDNSMVSSPLAGLTSLKSNSLKTYTTTAVADGVGAIGAGIDVTWATHKDTMIQSLPLTGLTASVSIVAGTTIELAGKYHTNPRTQQVVYDQNGNPVPFRWTVTASATTSSTGTVTLQVANAAIFDAASNNQYDNISAAPASGDVVTIQEAASTTYKPNLFYHKDAFSFGTIQLPKLYATDLTYQSKDGLTFRASRYANGDANSNILRLDLVPAFGVSNPLHAGRSYGLS